MPGERPARVHLLPRARAEPLDLPAEVFVAPSEEVGERGRRRAAGVPLDGHGPVTRQPAVEERLAVHRPGDLDAQRVRDGGQDVDRPCEPGPLGAAPLVRKLHEERHERDLLEVLDRRLAPHLPQLEAEPVVGDGDDERVVEEPARVELLEQESERSIRRADLEEIAGVRLLGERLRLRPAAVERLGEPAHVADRRPPRRKMHPRCVGEGQVQMVERRRTQVRERVDVRAHRRARAAAALRGRRGGRDALGSGGSEVPPLPFDRRQPVREGRRHDGVEVENRHVRGERPSCAGLRPRLGGSARVARAELRRADPRQPLARAQLVAVPEEREDVLRMVGEHRERVLDRETAREDRGHRVLRERMDGRRLAIERRRPRKAREVRVSLRVDSPATVEEGVRAELVEDEEDDRRARLHRGGGGGERLLRRQELRHRRVEEEERGDDERRRREHREDGPDGRHEEVGGARSEPEQDRDDDDGRAATEPGVQGGEGEEPGEASDDREVDRQPDERAARHGERLDGEQERRRNEHGAQGERDQVGARRAAEREELGVPPEEVEERLGERERRQDDDVDGRQHEEPRSAV